MSEKYFYRIIVSVIVVLLVIGSLGLTQRFRAENAKEKCHICELKFNTLNINYEISSFPEYLFFIFDI